MKLEWLVPVIVVIVYVIGWIVKAKEEIDAKAKKPAGKAPGQELDKFLEEIERLRRQNENAPKPTVSSNDQDELEAKPIVIRPAVRPAPVTPPRPVVTRPRPAPAVAAPVFAVTHPEDRPRPGVPIPKAGKSADGAAAFSTHSASMAGVLALLRKPRAISTAIMLNEILGPPKSQRR